MGKGEKDKTNMERDLGDARATLEETIKAKSEVDKQAKLVQGSIVDANNRLDDLSRNLNEAESSKKRLDVENQDLLRQIDELEAACAQTSKAKSSVATQLEDMKALGDAESKDRASLLTKFMSIDLANLREKIENENIRKSDAMKALSKAAAEIQLWRSRFETEGMGRIEELETGRSKLQSRIVEAEETVDSLQTKIANAEKARGRLTTELEEMAMEYERMHAATLIAEKRSKNFEKIQGEWQSKANDIVMEMEASQNEGRNYSSELFRLKSAQDEATEQLDIVKIENKNLADEIKDLLDQLGDGGRSIHDLDKQRRRLEQEKEELQAALEEAESTLEQEENKVLRAQMELQQVRSDIDRRVAEKEEEFNNTRKNHARAMESLSVSLESEQKSKAEALRIKKKLEGDINELEIGLDQANKANAEGLKALKRYQNQLRETIQGFEDEARARQQVSEQVGIADRKAAALNGEMEESRALLDSAERENRQLTQEISDARLAVTEMQSINSRDVAVKRNLEGSIHTVQAEIDGMLIAAKNGEEKAKKAMIDAARLADELRAEQDHSSSQLSAKKTFETQLGEMEGRLSDAEGRALKEGKNALTKLELRIRELEAELGSTQTQDGDKKNQDRMSDLASKLQQKIKTYKQQIEEA